MMERIFEDKFLLFDHPIEKSFKYYAKRLLYPLYCLYYRIILRLYRPENTVDTKQYKVAICAIFRDEEPILKEWIEYHRLVGVEHFYLYNNFSNDNYLEILQPYIDKGLVTLTDWPYNQSQMKAYQHCVDTFRTETKWLGFIDLDEFVVPNKQYNTIYNFLCQFDKHRPIVIIYWRYFGSSGLMNRNTDSLVTETFTSCWYKYANIGKFFYNTDYDYTPKEKYTIGYMHWRYGAYKGVSLPPINIFDNFCILGQHRVPTSDMPIQINHYLLKSYYEYKEKKAKRGGGVHKIQKGFHDEEYFFRHDFFCQSTDYHIFKYLVKLKLALGINK